MTQYDNTNRGSIWKNDKKRGDRDPDFTGSLNVDGHDYWVSAWRRKEGASEKAPALSFSVKRKDGKPRSAAGEYEDERRVDAKQANDISKQPRIARRSSAEMDDEIPF